jgi:hypothetical protein
MDDMLNKVTARRVDCVVSYGAIGSDNEGGGIGGGCNVEGVCVQDGVGSVGGVGCDCGLWGDVGVRGEIVLVEIGMLAVTAEVDVTESTGYRTAV